MPSISANQASAAAMAAAGLRMSAEADADRGGQDPEVVAGPVSRPPI